MTTDPKDFPILGSPFQRLVLRLRRVVDKTAFICVGCCRIKGNFGERIGHGWACSQRCGDLERNLIEAMCRVDTRAKRGNDKE
jgi:hypothetical protein